MAKTRKHLSKLRYKRKSTRQRKMRGGNYAKCIGKCQPPSSQPGTPASDEDWAVYQECIKREGCDKMDA